jgi:high-affinity nickel permease
MKFVTLRTERIHPGGDYIVVRNGENYVMTKSTSTFTQSGLLAMLLHSLPFLFTLAAIIAMLGFLFGLWFGIPTRHAP